MKWKNTFSKVHYTINFRNLPFFVSRGGQNYFRYLQYWLADAMRGALLLEIRNRDMRMRLDMESDTVPELNYMYDH